MRAGNTGSPYRAATGGGKVYAGVGPSDARELNQLRDEKAKLKRLVAALSLD